jgi:hypothetical protein
VSIAFLRSAGRTFQQLRTDIVTVGTCRLITLKLTFEGSTFDEAWFNQLGIAGNGGDAHCSRLPPMKSRFHNMPSRPLHVALPTGPWQRPSAAVWILLIVFFWVPAPWCAELHGKSVTLVVLAGQSNAVGSGSYAAKPPENAFDPNSSYWIPSTADQSVRFSFQVNNAGINAVNPATGQVVVDSTSGTSPSLRLGLVGQDQPWKDPAKRFPDLVIGPEVGIARGLYDPISSPDVAIVKVTYGATRIESWQKGATAGLFTMMKNRVELAKVELQNMGFSDVKVNAFFWQQGESDAGSSSRAAAYQGRMQTLINDFRSNIGTPDTKVVLGGILTNKFAFASTINAAMKTIADSDPKTAWFSTDDLGIANTADQFHFSYNGVLGMGSRFASNYVQMSVPEPAAVCLAVMGLALMGRRRDTSNRG